MNVLMIVTSRGELGSTGKHTGLWLEELARPFHEFKSHGYFIDIASPNGGEAPIDPRSMTSIPALFTAYLRDHDIIEKVRNTIPLGALDAAASKYDAYFVVGGHGIMWDGPDNQSLQRLLGSAFDAGHVVAAICHGPAALVNARLGNGELLVKGRRVCSFTDEEERQTKLDKVVPFFLESKLRQQGALFECAAPNKPCVVMDGKLLTGQNAHSALPLARNVVAVLQSMVAQV